MPQVTESDYRSAQENPRLRQEFLNSLDLEDAKEFVKGISYKPLSLFRKDFLACCFTLPWKKRSSINVYPLLFSTSYSEMISTLVDHEGHHARVESMTKSPLKLFAVSILPGLEEFLKEVTEISSLNKQLVNSDIRGLSREKTIDIEEELKNRYYSELIQDTNRQHFNTLISNYLCGPASNQLNNLLMGKAA